MEQGPTLPTVAYWMGEPLSEMPRERIIEIISELARENSQLRREVCDRSVQHINDLAVMARARSRERLPFLAKLLA